jgi:Uma2 family endonuclease
MSLIESSHFSSELIEYPSSDGKPMADNTKQARWIISLYNNLSGLFHGQDVFIAADLLWYPVEGSPKIVAAPDVMLVFGRPQGDRSSYMQWREEDIAPQVVFEILSPSNDTMEMLQKQRFYARHGVEELIVIDPGKKEGDAESFIPYVLSGKGLVAADFPQADWTSPRLGVRFRQEGNLVKLFSPDGQVFRSFEEIQFELKEQENLADAQKKRAEKAEAELAILRARLKELEG